MARPPLPREHGTLRGYRQHQYHGEALCDACAVVRRAWKQPKQYNRRNDGKCAPGLGWPLVTGSAP